MVGIRELISKIKFWSKVDRLGPDIPTTHWMLHFPTTARELCKKKFKHFGNNSEFRYGAYAIGCSKIQIGDNVVIRPNTMLFASPGKEGKGIIIEDDVLVGSGVHIYTANHNYYNPRIPIINQGHIASKEVKLRKGCWIGANAILLPGVEVGEQSVVGAGSVVTSSVPRNVVSAGNPSKIIKSIC